MEHLSHSHHTAKLSKRAAHANAATKGIYDDVFGGPPKFGVPTLSPRIEDYSEIFGGFHAPRISSIPVLDLPAVDDQEAFFDARSSAFDYSEVFGGFNGLDFADGFEELVADQQRSGSVCGSSEEAWTPAASESLSDETDHSESNQCVSNGGSHHSYDGNIEYTISYHKTNLSSDSDMSNGLRHASQMHAVPGFSYIVDQTNSSKAIGNVHQFYQQGGGDDGCPDVGYNQKMVKEKHLKKTWSDTSNGSIAGQGFSDDVRNRRQYDRVSSCPDKGFVTISELNLRTAPSHLPPPSRPPPVLDAKMGYASGSGSSKKSASLEGTEGDSSPSFFDVEVDASSSAAAAASAAAMKETVAKARAQLRNAKELMERKQDGFQNRAKMTANSDLREPRRKDREDKNSKGSCQRDSNGVKLPQLEEKQNLANAGQTNPAKTQGKDLPSPKVAVGLEDTGEWKEATQFFDLVKSERSKVSISEMDQAKQLSESSNYDDNGLEEVKLSEEVYRRHGNLKDKTIKEAQMFDVQDPKEYHQAEYGKPSAPKEANIQEDQQKKDKVTQDAGQQEVHKKLNAVRHSQALSKFKSSVDSYNRERLHEVQIDVGEFEVRQLMGEKKYDINLTESSEKMTDEGCIWKQHGAKGTIKRQTEVSEMDEEEGIYGTILGESKKEKGQQKVSKKDQTERTHKLIQKSVEETATKTETNVPEVKLAKEDNGRTLEQICEQEHTEGITEAHDGEERDGSLCFDLDLAEEPKRQEAAEGEKGLQEALLREEGEHRRKQLHTQEDRKKLSKENEKQETEKKEREAFQLGDLKRRKEDASDHEEKKRRQWQALEKEEKEKVLKEVRKLEEKEKRLHKAYERQEDKNRLQEARIPEERVREAYEREGTEKVLQTLQHTKENEKNIKEDSEINFFRTHAEASQTHEVKGNYGQEYEQEIDDALKETFELEQIDFELSEGTYFGDSDGFGKAHKKDEACKQNNIVDLQADDLAAVIPTKPLETIEPLIDADNEVSRNQSHSGGGESAVDEMEKTIDGSTGVTCSAGVVLENRKEGCGIGDSIKPLTDNGLKAAAAGIVIEGAKFERSSESQHQQRKASVDQRDKEKNISQLKVHNNEEAREDKFASSQSIHGESKKGSRMDLQSAACSTQRTLQSHASETESRKENVNRTITPEEKDADRVRKDQELENYRLRKIEEEREREREREKDRMAVDRAILEARERAFSEARERPERATVERATVGARQRSLIDARERLEKLCAEAKERSLPDKDAKIRAERAVVERAMAEARQRAAEKTAYEGRERVDRSFSDNFSAPRYNGMRQSSLPSDLRNSQDQAVGSTISSRQQYSSGYVASSSTEKPEGDEGESTQRCRARLERHRRTAERAANALAEKNMRDLVAQREQAERNRLAETLDGEVKRWSSGKEGNLRALLSTLQYILGPGSGWQPIPLTEVITSVAVKKAYRKATLCVHPDKLQQRGASIQQKYICEKVFDLLKEAWSKFNNEER